MYVRAIIILLGLLPLKEIPQVKSTVLATMHCASNQSRLLQRRELKTVPLMDS